MRRNIQREEIPKYQQRYQQRGREGKTRLLNEFCEQYEYDRKHAIKLLLGKVGYGSQKKKAPLGRPKTYGVEVVEVIKEIWLASEQPCGKRLKGMIPEWLPYYQKPIAEETKKKVERLSASQMDRLLSVFKSKYPKRLCGTKPGTLLKSQIPIKTQHWDVSQPGYMEADTVAHCGGSLEGDFIWSVVLTDIQSGWTTLRGVWNKGAHGVLGAVESMEKALPFDLKGFDSDNGGEFLNYHLLNYLQNRPHCRVEFTRSRPYHKDDNAHVEQKNWTHARQLLGYDRLENPDQVDEINLIYKTWELLQNFFCANLKLREKKRVGSKWVKSYHGPLTPYRRLLQSQGLSEKQKQALEKTRASLNPFELKKRLERQMKNFHKSARRFSRPSGSLHSSPTSDMTTSTSESLIA